MGRGGKQIITDNRVLTADYLPNKMVHREGERQEIARNLRPLLEDGRPNDMLLFGPPGTGKTAMARYVIESLKEETKVQSSYVNCFSQKSRFEIFYELLDEKLTTPRDGTSTEKVVDLFEEKTRKAPTIVIIDEVDQITSDDVLYELSRFQNTAMIFIANDRNVFSHFEDRVRSRFTGLKNVKFRKYSNQQIADILDLRAEHGLGDSVISRSQLETLASKSNGDARIAVNSLRFAANEAENKNLDKIPDDTVDESVTSAENEKRIESLDRLNKHQKQVYEILSDDGEMQIGDLYGRYCESVEDEKSRRTLLRYLKKMVNYDILESEGATSSRSYRIAE